MENNSKVLYDLIFKVSLLYTAVEKRVDFFEIIRSTSLEEYNRESQLYPLNEHTYKLFKKLTNEILNIKQEPRKFYVKFTKHDTYKDKNGVEIQYQNNCGFCVKDLHSYSIKRPFDNENTVVENLVVKEIKTNKIIYQGKDYEEYLKVIGGKK